MMKMNGLKIKDYWIMTYLFNGIMSLLTLGLFYLFGYYVV